MSSHLKDLLGRIATESREGSRKALSHSLRELKENRRKHYHESKQLQLQATYADALYKMLLLEMDEEEEESIEIAELAYLSVTSALREDPGNFRELYKLRMLLLHYFCDYFTDAIIEIFLNKFRSDNLLEARSLAIECIEKMQLADIFRLEEEAPDFLNHDEQLIDACNTISIAPELSEEEQKNAELLHQVFYAYLTSKYKN